MIEVNGVIQLMATDDAKDPLMGADDLQSTDRSDWELFTQARNARRKNQIIKKSIVCIVIILPWVLLGALGIWSSTSLHECRTRYYIRPDLIYSPVQHVVEYETKIYISGGASGDRNISPYALEPSDEVDELWTDLYPSLVQLIPQDEAAKLGNKTILYPHDEQHRYMIELNVFHELHCLNMIRQAMRPDYYHHIIREGETEDVLLGPRHITHCIDLIRQSLMCSSDITPYTWTWDEKLGYSRNVVNHPHTCRNFDAIKEWARVNSDDIAFDPHYREPNDPLDPATWVDGYQGR